MALPFSLLHFNRTGFAAVLTLAGLLRLSVPHSKYFFFPLLIAGFILALYDFFKSKQKILHLTSFLLGFAIVILTILIHWIAFLRTSNPDIFILKEFLNALSVIPFAFTIFQLTGTPLAFTEYMRKTLNILLYVGIILLLAGFMKLGFELAGVYFKILNPADYPIGTALTNDRNFYTLVLIFSLVVLVSKITQKLSIGKSFLIQALAYVFTVGIILTTSRRAMLILMALHGLMILYLAISFYNGRRSHGITLLKNTFLYWLIIFFTSLSLFVLSKTVKLKDFERVMTKNGANTAAFQAYISTLTYQVKSMVVKEINMEEVHMSLWYSDIKQLFPLSGAGNERFTKVIAPEQSPVKDSIITLDKNSQYNVLYNTVYSFTRLGTSPRQTSACYQVSLWCLVTDDFNGDVVILSSGKNLFPHYNIEYDLNKIGTWQELSMVLLTDSILTVPSYMAFSKYNNNNFDNLTGKILVTKPNYRQISAQIAGTLRPKQPAPEHPFISIPKFETTHLLTSSESLLQSSLAIPRIERWRFGWHLFSVEYSLWKKITGGGFGYMKQYAINFFKTDQRVDWPHNPLISVTLYSGLFGLLVYITLTFYSIYLFLKHIRILWIFALCYFIVLFFSLFSGNNPFDPPLIGYIITIPLLYHIMPSPNKIDSESTGK